MNDAIEGLIGAKSPTEAARAFLRSMDGMDVMNTSHRIVLGGEIISTVSTVPDSWSEHYVERGYASVDPGLSLERRPSEARWMSFDPNHPSFHVTGLAAQMFQEGRGIIGEGAYNRHFKTPWGTSTINVFTSAHGHQFDLWKDSFEQRLLLMTAMFNETVLSLSAPQTPAPPEGDGLTVRERDCVAWLAMGLRVSGIAHKMGVSERTVEFHIKNARQKMNAPTRESLVAKVLVGGF